MNISASVAEPVPPAIPPVIPLAPLPGSARERILAAAHQLFYRHGIRATGVDAIIAASGVAKMSFYRNFPSKANLVAEFLEERHLYWMNWFSARVLAHAGAQAATLPLVADALGDWFASENFRGCAFINTVAETAQDGVEHAIARRHKQDLLALLHSLLPPDIDPARAQALARSALIIVEGAIVRAQMGVHDDLLQDVRMLLQMLSRNSHTD